MKTKTLKMLTVVATLLLIVALGTSTVFAAIPQPNQIKPNGNVNGINEMSNVAGKILGILNTVGVILAVVILSILGIKYMMGSAEEKAEYKKTMIPYVIGAVLVFAAPTLANVVYQFINSMNN